MKSKIDWLGVFKVADLLALITSLAILIFTIATERIINITIGAAIYYLISNFLNLKLLKDDALIDSRATILAVVVFFSLLISLLGIMSDFFYGLLILLLIGAFLFYVPISLIETIRYFVQRGQASPPLGK